MSSIAYNLSKKLEWMARRLRHIDDVEKMKEWIELMSAITRLLKDTDKEGKEYRDEWRPWQQRNIRRWGLKKNIDEDEPEKGVKKITGKLLPPLRSPAEKKPTASHELNRKCRSTSKGKTGIKDDGGKNPGDNDRRKKIIKLDPKAAVMEMLESKDQQERNKMQVDESSPRQKMNIQIWRNDMLKVAAKVKKEHWGDVQSGNFRRMIGDCTPNWVNVSVIKDMGHRDAYDYLYKELMKFYDKGC